MEIEFGIELEDINIGAYFRYSERYGQKKSINILKVTHIDGWVSGIRIKDNRMVTISHTRLTKEIRKENFPEYFL